MTAFWTGVTCAPASGQQIPNLTPEQLQQLQQVQSGQSTPVRTSPPVTSQSTILEPTTPSSPPLAESRLERILSARAGTVLRQFGYDQMGVGHEVTLPQVGAIQDDYIMGPGDEVIVSLRGQENAEYRVDVDRDGRVTLPRLNPVLAAGRNFGEFRQDLVAAIHRAYVSTEGYVSVGRLRQISVLVSGEVNSPGVRTLTGLSTPVDAILVSGGIKKTGSLRNVYILRGGRRITVDLYSVLTGHGEARQIVLADGDRIVVPPLGPTVAVAGWVRRPGIYEIANGRSAISVRDLLSLAGGLEVRGKYRLSVLRVAPDGRSQMTALQNESGTTGDSDILFVQLAADQTVDQATLSGGTALAGQYSIKDTKLSEILRSPGALGNNPYTLFGVISRRDPVTLMRTLIAFTPVAVLKGSEDMDVQSGDIVRTISAKESQVLFLAMQQYNNNRSSAEEALRNPQSTIGAGTAQISGTTSTTAAAVQAAASQSLAGQNAREALAKANTSQSGNEAAGQQSAAEGYVGQLQYPMQPQGQYPMQPQRVYPNLQQPVRPLPPNLEEEPVTPGETPTNRDVTSLNQLASQLHIDPLVLVNFLEDHSVNIDGAVRGAGLYLVGPDADLSSLLMAAGGVQSWADKNSVEVISTTVDANTGTSQTNRKGVSLTDAAGADYIVSPHDEVRVNAVFTDVGIGSVTVQGQVRHDGTYQIVRGEHLSDLLMRAGGLTDSAYPYGTVFLRKSAAEREQDAFRREASEIEDQLLLAMSRRDPNSKLSPDAFTAMQSYVNELKIQKALGRVTVVADPTVLAAHPGMDPLLEPGDVVYVPQRPFAVSVLGQVLQPGSVPFRPDMTVADYIAQAGGYSQFADKSETFVVLPDGSARRAETSWLDFSSNEIPPGSTIFVSRDISGIDLHQIIVDTTSIFAQLATSAAALAVLSKQ
ncbi:MAG: SLBB domain-containing protein [Alphaproteobacteria bacterium]|nr:SLBB domain-containing protein [Alphaproteobacteria bacterium]MDE2495644.1 SLBB domain-containing protein [Alphaproteobacteria bacterium]